jgi:hypothetical protein
MSKANIDIDNYDNNYLDNEEFYSRPHLTQEENLAWEN